MATYYIDPTWGGTKSGTFALPWSTYASLPALSAGDVVMQKFGTTATENVVAAGSGTSGNPIIYGVYDALGARILTTVGAATISGTASVAHNFSTGGQSFVEAVGLAFTNIKDNSVYGIRLGSNSASADGNAARYCSVTSQTCAAGFLIFTNGGTHTVDHCVSSNNIGYGIIIAQQSSGKVTVTNNTCNYNSEAGVRSIFSSALLLGGKIEHNDCSYNGTIQAVLSHGIGIDIITDSADLFIQYNTCNSNYIMGIRSGSFSKTATSNQTTIAFNTCNTNGEYGMQGVSSGGWFISRNTCNYNGSNRGNKYGRGIELFGGSTTPVGPGIVCFNTCSYNYNYGGTINNGTEGGGIGLDDYHRDITVYGNLVQGNEGNGIQWNPNGATGTSMVHGNILIDNFAAPTSRSAGWVDYIKAQMCTFGTENNVNNFNNTIILTSSAAAPSCKYAISESSLAAGTATSMRNNIIKGPHVAAMKVRTGITRTNNGFYGCTKNVESNADTTTLSDGTGAVTTDPQLDSNYRPQAAAYKRTGASLGGKDYNGKPFYSVPNIGAVDDITATPRWALFP